MSRVAAAWLAAVLAVFVALLLAYGKFRSDLAEERARVAAGRIAQTACGPIEYASAGDGPPILVVHGAGGGWDQGLELGAAFARAGFRVVAMSRFGYLGTALPADGSAQAQADAHACLLDALAIERAAVMGFSAGAPSSLQFALRHPQRTAALVLVVPATYAPRPGSAPSVTSPRETQFLFDTALRSDFLYWLAIRIAPGTVTQAILATPRHVVAAGGAPEQARVAQILDHILPISGRREGLLNDGRIVSALPRYDLERIAAPTLAVSAKDDLFGTFETARYTAAAIPGARFAGYPTGGHILAGRQDEANAAIAAFLREK